MILLLKYNNKTNICFLMMGSLSIFSFCNFGCFVGFVLWFRWVWFDLWFVGFWVFVVIWFWLGFSSGAWLEVMSFKSSGHGGLEGELNLRGRVRRDEKGFRPRIWRRWDLGSNHRGVVALMFRDGAWWSAMEHKFESQRSERVRSF